MDYIVLIYSRENVPSHLVKIVSQPQIQERTPDLMVICTFINSGERERERERDKGRQTISFFP